MRHTLLVPTLAALALAACRPATPSTAGNAATSSAQPPALSVIKEADLRRDLFVLGGDGFRGREGGTLDELRASAWMADRMREGGLEPAGEDGTYYQWFSIRRYRQSSASGITLHGSDGASTLTLPNDVAVLAPFDASLDLPLVFVEAGAPIDTALIRGKAVATTVAPAPLPAAAAGSSGAAMRARAAAGAGAVRGAAARFLNAGAVAVVVASDAAGDESFYRQRDAMERGRYGIDTIAGTSYWPDPRASTRRPASPTILWVPSTQLPTLRRSQRLVAAMSTENYLYPSVNLVGRIKGTDPVLAKEFVLYSSHQDHDGVRTPIDGDSIWNGADDNATGSVALLAIARAFKQRPGKRSALFVWHGAEERGLLGSRHFVMHPLVPKSQIVAVLNAEMMGRNHPDSMTILGAIPPHRNSTMLVEWARQANRAVAGFSLDTTWDMRTHREGWYFRSDHLPYARANIPAIMFSSNLHPDYHTPRDEPATIDYGKLTRATRWMYATGWLVANASMRPPIDPDFKLER